MNARILISSIFFLLAAAYCTAGQAQGVVETGLYWLAGQQAEDGSWTFDEDPDSDVIVSAHPQIHATSLALLTLLGAGASPDFSGGKSANAKPFRGPPSDRQDRITAQGLRYLVLELRREENRDLAASDPIAHSVAAFALVCAFDASDDDKLRIEAQRAIRAVEATQRNDDGGWGVGRDMGSDMHLFGWQMLALRSADLAGLEIADETKSLTGQLLDLRQASEGRFYGRFGRGRSPQATAIGLWARDSWGWTRDDKHTRNGAKWLADAGPAQHDIERNFFAQLFLQSAGHVDRVEQLKPIRDLIVERRIQHFGPAKGPHGVSWYDEVDTSRRGRLYQTTLNLLTLEIYYRHLRVFGEVP